MLTDKSSRLTAIPRRRDVWPLRKRSWLISSMWSWPTGRPSSKRARLMADRAVPIGSPSGLLTRRMRESLAPG
jgi:hypothetical protein